jgi:predicted metal-dependent hydrolase
MSSGGRVVLQGGRAKAYRPMPAAARRKALEAGLEAYANDDFFEAHELLEPPWMGARDLGERELLQGIIKLAAAFVHGARGNPVGIEKNLRGARARLANGTAAGPQLLVDVPSLLEAVDARLAAPMRADDPAIAIPRLPPPA